MTRCSACGFQFHSSFRFCPECGTKIGPSNVSEERKVVTIVFYDLVGFTQRSESLDPEDVKSFLLPYYDLMREEVTRHGGMIDKFLGDGVMAIFGVPTAHEDDPERAVRAALRVVERVPGLELNLHVRIGINTGEVVVAPDALERGDAITGDAANTASRLQGAAPLNGIVVGEGTYLVTEHLFDYETLEPATVKGKSDPLAMYRPIAPIARQPSELIEDDTPFVGRDAELASLIEHFGRSRTERSIELVTIVAEPGMGKSRLVREFARHVEALPELITWREGRCLPYGEGIAFWALAEIVRSHAGILDTDGQTAIASKIDQVLTEPDEQLRAWMRAEIAPLVGLDTAGDPGARAELFAAWRRFLIQIAERGPLVLVVEDLHWADDALVQFLSYLADNTAALPILVVMTARPEVEERHPAWFVGEGRSRVISLTALPDEDMTTLIKEALRSSSSELISLVLERASGSPLYAEQLSAMLSESGAPNTGDLVDDTAMPPTIHALLASRVDQLAAEPKTVLLDASVIGKVFWSGAIAAVENRGIAEVDAILEELTRRAFVRPVFPSSMEGQREFSFSHALVRDVAYAQLPRAARAARHVAVASWVGSVISDGVGDFVEILAYHYASAVQLYQAAGEAEKASEWTTPAFRFLSLAGERALGLDARGAVANLDRALGLLVADDPQRADALARFGQAAFQAGRSTEAVDAFEQALTIFLGDGRVTAAASTMVRLAQALSLTGDRRAWELPNKALALLEPLGPSDALVGVLTEVARVETLQQREEEAIKVADRAIATARLLGLAAPARALGYRGLARADRGDPDWVDDLREAIILSKQAGEGREVALLLNNLATELWAYEGPQAGVEGFDEGLAYARPRGLTEMVVSLEIGRMEVLLELGEVESALLLATELVSRLESHGTVWDLIAVRATMTQCLSLRGDPLLDAEALDWLEEAARSSSNVQLLGHGLGASAVRRAGLGQCHEALALLRDVAAFPGAMGSVNSLVVLPGMVRAATLCGDLTLAKALVDGCVAHYPYATHSVAAAEACLAEASKDFEDALQRYERVADGWQSFGVVAERAFALLGHGRCLVHLSRGSQAITSLRRAHEIFTRLQATADVAEIDRLLLEIPARSDGLPATKE